MFVNTFSASGMLARWKDNVLDIGASWFSACSEQVLNVVIFGTGAVLSLQSAIHDMCIFVGLASSVFLCKLDLLTSKGFESFGVLSLAYKLTGSKH